uniref:phage terminase small subunit n=1 Tax=Longimycelium tulufanense TaxID=907463 RepID=UPI001E30EB7C|nr:hypothetical protein [Longimycelium tulufanense]
MTAIGRVEQPPLDLDDPHPLVVDFYDSLRDSAQARYYEPSDWQYARLVLWTVDRYLKSRRPSAQLYAAITSSLTDLLVSEGARRRVRLEVEREQATGGQLADVAALFRERLAQ